MPSCRNAYRGVLLGYAGVCALWVPLLSWMMPNDSFRVGSIYMMRPNGRFEVKQRSELGRQYRRGTMLQVRQYVARYLTKLDVQKSRSNHRRT